MTTLWGKSFSWLLNTTLAGAVSLAVAAPALAQQAINSIEVLVNDDPISTFDIDQRLRLVIAISGGVDSEQKFMEVRKQVIRSIVDERLQLQEAAENELTVEEDTLESFFARRAQGMGQSPEQLGKALAGIGSSKETMKAQMGAEYAWSQLVQGRLGSFVSVSDEEVEAFIQRIHDNKGKFEYRLGEIVLLFDTPEQQATVRANADAMVERIRGGASFPDIAQQLSASSSAAVGGDLGWLNADDLSAEALALIQSTDVGNVAAPLRTAGGYTIYALRDRRRVLVADPLDAQLSLKQLLLTPENVALTAKAQAFEAYVTSLKEGPTSCEKIGEYAQESGADGSTEVGTLRLRDLNIELRENIAALEVGKAGEVLKMDDGWRVLFVCARQAPEVKAPDFDEVYNQIEQQRLSMMARRYLRDLRRDAIVDYR